jgi:hypothetical protein
MPLHIKIIPGAIKVIIPKKTGLLDNPLIII